MRQKKYYHLFSFVLLLAAAFFGLSCNSGVVGYNCESGCSISVPADKTFSNEPNGVLVVHSFEVTSSIGGPANGIQVQLICNKCTIRDSVEADGGPIQDPEATTTVGTTYFVATNKNGRYQLVIELDPPSSDPAGTFTATVGHDIGVDGGDTNYTISE